MTRVATLSEQVDAALVPERLVATVSGFFGALGAVIAGIGLYGLLSYSVARRTTEIGVRMALGATRGHVVRLVLRGAGGLIAVGLAIGLPLTFPVGRLLGNQLYGMSPYNLLVTLGAVLALGSSALVASFVPAWRASLVSPLDALRSE